MSQLTPSPLGAPAGMPRSQVTHFLHVSAGGYFHKHACFCSMREICIRTFFLSGSTLLKVDDYLERSSLIEIISCLKPFFFRNSSYNVKRTASPKTSARFFATPWISRKQLRFELQHRKGPNGPLTGSSVLDPCSKFAVTWDYNVFTPEMKSFDREEERITIWTRRKLNALTGHFKER